MDDIAKVTGSSLLGRSPRRGTLWVVLAVAGASATGLALLAFLPATMATMAAAICGVLAPVLVVPVRRGGHETRAGLGVLALGCVVLGGHLVDGAYLVGWPVLACGLAVAAIGVAATTRGAGVSEPGEPPSAEPGSAAESALLAPFQAEVETLSAAASQLEQLLAEVDERWPSAPIPTESIRQSVGRSMANVEEAVARWRWAPERDPQKAAEIEGRLAACERLEESTGDEGLRKELQLTMACQRQVHEARQELDRDEQAFRLGLERLSASLESLTLSVQRAVVSGRDVDTVEVDALVAALAEASEAIEPGRG